MMSAALLLLTLLTTTPDLRALTVTVCLGVVEEVTGLPPWQARYLAPRLYEGRYSDPLGVIRSLKGSVFALGPDRK